MGKHRRRDCFGLGIMQSSSCDGILNRSSDSPVRYCTVAIPAVERGEHRIEAPRTGQNNWHLCRGTPAADLLQQLCQPFCPALNTGRPLLHAAKHHSDAQPPIKRSAAVTFHNSPRFYTKYRRVWLVNKQTGGLAIATLADQSGKRGDLLQPKGYNLSFQTVRASLHEYSKVR